MDALSECRLDTQRGADRIRPLSHDGKSPMVARRHGVSSLKTDPVIIDRQRHVLRCRPERHLDVSGPRVLDGVGKRLLRNAEKGGLGNERQPGGEILAVHGDRHGEARA